MPIHQTARTFGTRRVPELLSASGCWQLGEVTQARRAGIWPTSGDLFFSDVVLLLPLTGSSGSTTFTDASNSPKSITAFGNASVTTAAADPFGNTDGILELDGSGDYLTAANSSAFDLAGDFTIECWFYADTTATASLISYTAISQDGFALGPSSTAGKVWWYHNGSARILSGSTFTTGTWVHLAVVRSGTTITMWLDGSSEGLYTENKTFTAVADILIGNDQFNQDFDGKISNVRITNAARYTAAFTPPTAPFATGQ